jgi:hypothetical protein
VEQVALMRATRSPRLRLLEWWFDPIPRGRIAALRAFVYAFVLADVFIVRPWVSIHGQLPVELYEPLFIARFLPLPAPTPLVVAILQGALVVATLLALTGRWPRVAGASVFFLYLGWMLTAFSYGKVDHDNVAFLVALAVLPTVGRARWGDMEADEASGWAIRCVQVAVVMTYFASVFAKLRFGGVNWVTGSTFLRAVIKRGTSLAEPLAAYPLALKAGQVALVAFELLSPLLLVRGRVGRLMLGAAVAFHVITFLGIGIMFWPHVVCLMSFLPLERLNPRAWWQARLPRLLNREAATIEKVP